MIDLCCGAAYTCGNLEHLVEKRFSDARYRRTMFHSRHHPSRGIRPQASSLAQKQAGNTSIKGIMLESHIYEGKQSLNMGHKEELAYGISITDGCISFEETDGLLREMYSVL